MLEVVNLGCDDEAMISNVHISNMNSKTFQDIYSDIFLRHFAP